MLDLLITRASLPAGRTNMSLGVQDFDLAVQEAVNRVQSIEETESVLRAARANGFKSISVDLIYGLPKQSVQGFAKTLDTVLAARPNRFAVYAYAHLPQMFKPQKQIKVEDLATPETRLQLLELTIDKLSAAGYIYIGMDHFALPDDELVQARESGLYLIHISEPTRLLSTSYAVFCLKKKHD